MPNNNNNNVFLVKQQSLFFHSYRSRSLCIKWSIQCLKMNPFVRTYSKEIFPLQNPFDDVNNPFDDVNNQGYGLNLSEFNLDPFTTNLFEKAPGILWYCKGNTSNRFKHLIFLIEKCHSTTFSSDSVRSVLFYMQDLRNSMDSVNASGYVKSLDITQMEIISDLYPTFFNINKASFVSNNVPEGYVEVLKWSYNLFTLHLLLLSIYLANYIIEIENPDLFNDLKTFEKDLSGSLDTSIRLKLRKRGISFIQNIYCGFDTEYKNIDAIHNNLLSAQLAVNTQTLLKIPLSEEYNFGVVNSITGEITPESGINTKGFSTSTVLNIIRSGLKIYRDFKYPEYDDSMNLLIEGLKSEGVNCITAHENMIFIFANTTAKEYFKRTLDGVYSLQELVSTSKILVQEDLTLEFKNIVDKLKQIYENDTSFNNYNNNNNKNNNNNYNIKEDEKKEDEKSLINLPSVTDLPRIKIDTLKIVSDRLGTTKPEKRRTWMTSFTPMAVSVSVQRQMYLLIHNSAADLSVLSDFESFKDGLDLVNKCFVTLTTPLKIHGLEVKVRDTQLLAPGVSKSLHAISTLYPGIAKIKVSHTDITNMDVF